MTQQVRIRTQDTIPYAASDKRSIKLSRGYDYRELWLRLQGALTVSAANNTAANTLRGDEWAVVQGIELIANGDTVLRSMSGDELRQYGRIMYGLMPRITPTLGDGFTTNPSFDTTLILPFWSPRTVKPHDTILRSGQLTNLELIVNWGSHLSINATATAFGTAPTIEVTSVEAFGIPQDVRNPLTRIHRITATPAAANAEYSIDLPVGNVVYRGFLVNTRDNSGVDVGTLVRSFKLKSGPVELVSVKAAALQQATAQRNGIEPGLDLTAAATTPAIYAAYKNLTRSNKTHQDGWYFLDLCTDGYTTEALDAYGLSDLKLVCDVQAAGTINVLPIQIIPVR